MTKEIRIEHYLTQLDRELTALPLGQRAEIILEMKSHILDASEKNPTRSVDSIINDLGSPRQVAEKYLNAKGVTYQSPTPKTNWLKVFALGTAGVFAFFILSVGLLIWYFSPLIQVDEAKGHVSLFGGAIDVREDIGKVRVGSNSIAIGSLDQLDVLADLDQDTPVNEIVRGEEDLSGKNVQLIKIPFSNIKLKLKPSANQVLSWNCHASGGAPVSATQAGIMTLSLDKVPFANCTISVPSMASTELKGANGKIDLEAPQSAVKVVMDNGKVDIETDKQRQYTFDVKVQNGTQDQFPQSNNKDAIKIEVDVTNGVVELEDAN